MYCSTFTAGAIPFADGLIPEALTVPDTCVACPASLLGPVPCTVSRPPNSLWVLSAGEISKMERVTPAPLRLYGALKSGVTFESSADLALSDAGWSGGP